MTNSALRAVLATFLAGSTGLLASAAVAAQPLSYGCGDEGHQDGDKDKSFRLCGDEGHQDGDKDKSFRLCGDEGHQDGDKDES